MLDKVIKKGTKNVTYTVGIKFLVLLKESQNRFEHGSNATQGPFPWPGAQVFQTMLFFELSSSMIQL